MKFRVSPSHSMMEAYEENLHPLDPIHSLTFILGDLLSTLIEDSNWHCNTMVPSCHPNHFETCPFCITLLLCRFHPHTFIHDVFIKSEAWWNSDCHQPTRWWKPMRRTYIHWILSILWPHHSLFPISHPTQVPTDAYHVTLIGADHQNTSTYIHPQCLHWTETSVNFRSSSPYSNPNVPCHKAYENNFIHSIHYVLIQRNARKDEIPNDITVITLQMCHCLWEELTSISNHPLQDHSHPSIHPSPTQNQIKSHPYIHPPTICSSNLKLGENDLIDTTPLTLGYAPDGLWAEVTSTPLHPTTKFHPTFIHDEFRPSYYNVSWNLKLGDSPIVINSDPSIHPFIHPHHTSTHPSPAVAH